MAFHIDEDRGEATNPIPGGPAGVVVAEVGHDYAAEVDVASGAVVRVSDLAMSRPDGAATLRALVSDDQALDAIRRIVTSTVFDHEEPRSDPRLGVLDRVLARLELEAAVPDLVVHPADRELEAAVAIVREGEFDVTPFGAMRVQAVRDALRHKLPRLADVASTGELVALELAAIGMPLAVEASTAEPSAGAASGVRLVVLSAGPDLAHAMTGRPASLRAVDELEMVLDVPIDANYSGVEGRLACYVVEPDHAHPVAHISMFSDDVDPDGNRSLVARFRIADRADLDRFEFVVLPAGIPGGQLISPSVARSIMCGEIRLRTAIRLTQRGQQHEALASLRDSERAYRSARDAVPEHYWDRLDDIRLRIESDDYPSDLLSDCVPITYRPAPD